MADIQYYGTGRRKTSTARVYLRPGGGSVQVNRKAFEAYFPNETLRMIIQALQEYSREAKDIFENTKAPRKSEVIVLGEDIVQYGLEVAECYAINKRFRGFIDLIDLRKINSKRNDHAALTMPLKDRRIFDQVLAARDDRLRLP